jgi:DNA-binding winged helix-turn-helix (wHTH) protein
MNMLQSRATQSELIDTNGSAFSLSFQPEPGPAGDAAALNFDGFCLLPRERLLFYSGERLRIGDRALDVLIALVQRQGQIVLKSSLLEAVWPDLCVEENSLRVHILALRRILRDGQAGRRLIVTIVGRGYAFVGRTHCERSPRSGPIVGADTLGDSQGL